MTAPERVTRARTLSFEDILHETTSLDHIFYDNTFIACARDAGFISVALSRVLQANHEDIVPSPQDRLFQTPAFSISCSPFGVYVATFVPSTSVHRWLLQLFPEREFESQVTVNCQGSEQGSQEYRALVTKIVGALHHYEIPSIIYRQGGTAEQPYIIRARNLP